MNLSKCVDDVSLPSPCKKTKQKKPLVLGGAGCWLGATDPKDLQTTKEETAR